MEQLNLDFNSNKFDGAAYVPLFDEARLTGQILRIFNLMRDGKWRTLREIGDITGDGEASISAQLRNLKKTQFGSHSVTHRRRGEKSNGLFEYQLIVNKGSEQGEI